MMKHWFKAKLPMWFVLKTTAFSAVIAIGGYIQADEDHDVPELSLEEITVTAEREEASIFEVPISVTSFDDDSLNQFQITNLKDLEVRVPGLQFGLDSPATIRGIGSLYRGVGGDVAVAQYSNDIYFDEPYGVVSSMYDMERVEILRGPQGTLYGRNSIAGAINYINKRPDPAAFDMGMLAELTSFNGRRLNAHGNLPVGTSMAVRLTAEWQEADGNQENISGPDLGGRGDFHIAPQFRFKNESLDFNIRYARFEHDAAAEVRVPVRYPNIGVEFHANPLDGYPSEERNQFYRYPTTKPPSTIDGDLKNRIDMNRGGTFEVLRESVSTHTQFQLTDSLAVKHIFGKSDVFIKFLDQDCDGSSVLGSADNRFLSANAGVPYEDCSIRAFVDVLTDSNEFQVTYDQDGFSALAGVYLLEQDIHNEYKLHNIANQAAGVSSADSVPLEAIFGAPVFYPDPDNENEFIGSHEADGSYQTINLLNERTVEARALFGQVNMQLNENWQATAGLRTTEDEKNLLADRLWAVLDLDEENLTDAFVIPARYNVIDPTSSETFDKLIGNISLEYSTADSQLIYGRIASGYRSGGISPGAPEEYATYDDEDLISFEAGYKADLYDNRFRVLLSGFSYNFKNYQQPIQVRIAGPGGQPYSLTVVANLPDTSINGFEFESTFIVSPYLSIEGFYAFQTSSLGELYATDPVNPNQRFEEVTYQTPRGLTATTFLGEEFALEGNELPNMPNHKWSISGNGLYRFDDGASVAFTLSYSYTGERFNRIFNIDNDRLDAYSRVDATATWMSADNKHQVTAFIENIFDTIGMMELESNGWDAGYYQDATLTDPRFLGLLYRWSY